MSLLKQANHALRNGQYETAIRLYQQSLQDSPALAHIIQPNLKLAQSRHQKTGTAARQPSLPALPPKSSIDFAAMRVEDIISGAEQAMARDDWHSAYEHWNSLLTRPDEELSPQLLLRTSRELFKLDAFPQAAAALQRAATRNPQDPDVIREQAHQYYYHCYSSWLMLVTENKPDWYKADGLDKRPDWKTACELLEKAEKVSPRHNLRRYVQAYLLLAEDAWDKQNRTQAHAALDTALKAIGPNKLDQTLVQAIHTAVDQFRDGQVPENDPYYQTLQDQLKAMPLELLDVKNWLCLNDILNWNGLLLCGYVAREKAVDLALEQGKKENANKATLKTALKAALDRNDTKLADTYLGKLKRISPDAIDVRELDSCTELMKGNLDAFRQKWPHPPTPAEQRLRDYLKGKTVAVVGPAPTGTLDGEEIDRHDVVVRMNWRGQDSMPDAREFGSKTNISLYNAHTVRLLTADKRLEQTKSLDFRLIRRARHDAHQLQMIAEYPGSFYKSLNAVPAILFNLLLHGAEQIKLFKVTFYLGKQHHAQSYRGQDNGGYEAMPLRGLQPVMANHDLSSQVGIIKRFKKTNNIFTTSLPISHFLLIQEIDYFKQVTCNLSSVYTDDSNGMLSSMRLEVYLNELRARKKLRIAIIGNSPILLDSALGEEIDKFDLVIRLNNYATIGYENDVGRKTDIVFITPATHPNKELFNIPGYRIIIFCNGKFEDLDLAQQRMYADNGSQIELTKINILDIALVNRLTRDLSLKDRQWPSTGLLALGWCLETFNDIQYKISLFGFSFFKESGQLLKHYYGVETKRDKHHDFELEEKYVQKLQNKGALRVLTSKDGLLEASGCYLSRSNREPDIVIASHHDRERSSSPCVSVYHAFLNNPEYTGNVDYLYTKNPINDYKANLVTLLRHKRVFLFNGICSYLQHDYVVDSINDIYAAGSVVGVYWHETAWNINTFRRKWGKNWDRSIELFQKYDCFHIVPTSQNKQIVMLLTEQDMERIRVVFETIPDTGYLPRRQSVRIRLKIIGAGIPDERKGFDIFKRLSLDPELSSFDFIWHWHEDLSKISKKFNGIGRIDYRGYVEDFGSYLKENADLFLLTSRDDPSPIVALEALRADVPVICFDSTGYAELLPKEFVSRSYTDMKNKILEYANKKLKYSPGFFYEIYTENTPEKFIQKANLSDFLH